MAAFGIDPDVFGGVAALEEQFDAGDGDLRIEGAGENVRGRGRLVEKS